MAPDLSWTVLWDALAGNPVPAAVALLAIFGFGFYKRWWVPGWLDRERSARIELLTASHAALSASFDRALELLTRGSRSRG